MIVINRSKKMKRKKVVVPPALFTISYDCVLLCLIYNPNTPSSQREGSLGGVP